MHNPFLHLRIYEEVYQLYRSLVVAWSDFKPLNRVRYRKNIG